MYCVKLRIINVLYGVGDTAVFMSDAIFGQIKNIFILFYNKYHSLFIPDFNVCTKNYVSSYDLFFFYRELIS